MYAIAGADLVVGNLSDYAATTATVAAMRDQVFVQLATGTPAQARAMAAWAHAQRVAYLDGAIMATPDLIGQPGCTLLYAGPKGLFDAHLPVLAALGDNSVYVGADLGHANTLDAALLIVLWGAAFGTWHAAAICEAEGFPLDALATSLGATMPVIDATLQDSIERIRTNRFAGDATTMATVATCHASVRLIREMSERHGLELGLTEAFDRVFARAAAAGSQDDVSAVYRSLRSAQATTPIATSM